MKSLSRRQSDVYTDMVQRIAKGEPTVDLYQELIKLADIPAERTESRAIDGSLKRRPIIELLDVRALSTGAGGPSAIVNKIALSEPFVRVSRLIALHVWSGTTVDYDQWMGGTALTNGMNIIVDGRILFPLELKSMKDYMRYAYDTDVVVDSTGVSKNVYFTSRFSFHKFMGNREGIDLTDYDLEVMFREDFSSVGIVATWAFEGWGWDR